MKPPASDHLPSYSEIDEDSVLPSPAFLSVSQRQSQSATRSALINDLIRNHIIPQWCINATSAVTQCTLILVPSNVSDLTPPTTSNADSKDPSSRPGTFAGEVVVGFPSRENLAIVRLQGDAQTLEFWRQELVIEELERSLCETLQKDRLNVTAQASSDSQWRHLDGKALALGEATVGVEIRHICLRIQNQLGLYETRTGEALVVRVEFCV